MGRQKTSKAWLSRLEVTTLYRNWNFSKLTLRTVWLW